MTTTFNKTENTISYSTTLQGQEVKLTAKLDYDQYWEIEFTVNGTTRQSTLPIKNRIAITKWLLKCWSDIKQYQTKFICHPCVDDTSNPDWRAKAYLRLGFQPGYNPETGERNNFNIMVFNK